MSESTEEIPVETNDPKAAMLALMEGDDDTPETEPEELPGAADLPDDGEPEPGDSEVEGDGCEDSEEGEDHEASRFPEIPEDELLKESQLEDAIAAFDAENSDPGEAVEFARKALRSLRKVRNGVNRHYQKVSSRQERLNSKLENFKREAEVFHANKADFEARVKKLRSGDAETVLSGLRAFGITYDEITDAILADGNLRTGKTSPEVQELRDQIEQMRKEAQENNQRQQQAYQQELLNQARRDISKLAGDEDRFPFLSDENADEVVDAVFSHIGNHYQETGEELDPGDVLHQMEDALRQKTERRLKRIGASVPTGDPGRDTGAKKPGKPRRSAPGKKGHGDPDFSKMTDAQKQRWIINNIDL